MTSSVMTVLGPVDVDALGIVLPHEHLLMTFDWYKRPVSTTQPLAESPVTMDLLGPLRKDLGISRDNLRLTDVDLAVSELSRFRDAGGSTIVEMSVEGLGLRREELIDISRRTGVHIVAGCGWYVEPTHPRSVHDESVSELTGRLLAQLTASPDAAFTCGIMGEIGLSGPPTPDEIKVLRAALLAQRESDASISLHTNAWRSGESILRILEVLEQEDADPLRVVIGHLDWGISAEYIQAVAERGFWLEFDTFGYESIMYEHETDPSSVIEVGSDGQRARMVADLIDAGFGDQILVSQDVYTKTALRAYGGHGYAHILLNVVPMFRRYGLSEADIDKIMRQNPQRMLTGTGV